MSVIVKGMKMPDECRGCRWFFFEGVSCTQPRYYLDARCELIESGQDWYGKDNRGGWVGESIEHIPGWSGRYTYKHCIEFGTRAKQCPLVELPEKHGRLIDVKTLEKSVLKWLPKDPCGIEEKEFPFETDICVSMMMEIEEQPTVFEAEGEE